MMRIDARLPLRFGPLESRAAHEAVLLDHDAPAPQPAAWFTPAQVDHPNDCACCVPRAGAALALAALFRDRAVGQGAPFQGVVAVVGVEGEAAVRAALESDPVVSGRYRLLVGHVGVAAA